MSSQLIVPKKGCCITSLASSGPPPRLKMQKMLISCGYQCCVSMIDHSNYITFSKFLKLFLTYINFNDCVLPRAVFSNQNHPYSILFALFTVFFTRCLLHDHKLLIKRANPVYNSFEDKITVAEKKKATTSTKRKTIKKRFN